MQKTTDQLMNEIQNSHEIEKFLENNNGEFTDPFRKESTVSG